MPDTSYPAPGFSATRKPGYLVTEPELRRELLRRKVKAGSYANLAEEIRTKGVTRGNLWEIANGKRHISQPGLLRFLGVTRYSTEIRFSGADGRSTENLFRWD